MLKTPLKTLSVLTLIKSISSFVASASPLEELMVQGDIAVFKTVAAKTHSSPECVAADKKAQWAVDLKTHSGRAMYSSLVTALSTGADIEVSSNNACLAGSGYEQVAALNVKANKMGGSNGQSVRFVGFAKTTEGVPPRALDMFCDTTPATKGSRALRWEDYKVLKKEIDAALSKGQWRSHQSTWVIGAIQSASSTYNSRTQLYDHSVLMKDDTMVRVRSSDTSLQGRMGCQNSNGYGAVVYDKGRELHLAECRPERDHFLVSCVI
ncbi:hypothetical protein J8M21_23710 [Pseudoalteromonas luteoviolacea]|uniref:hypothetical protein n=1 Tax=Pseudoalteromonas luteoviolacea TaxID=43657 RepID=UPI001B3A2AE0|nr:hypothetical protein [Pseudoalteromonas luteoviolacea]MBQ4880213.1 hypothetical protein [Pseudoalteromonas luteoviolacea]MBQ4909274.1 hypothetical protein [Pseudoalteromonas luteoviolacea]